MVVRRSEYSTWYIYIQIPKRRSRVSRPFLAGFGSGLGSGFGSGIIRGGLGWGVGRVYARTSIRPEK